MSFYETGLIFLVYIEYSFNIQYLHFLFFLSVVLETMYVVTTFMEALANRGALVRFSLKEKKVHKSRPC